MSMEIYESTMRQIAMYRDIEISEKQMNYIILFDVRADVVNIVGIFHQLENYPNKL